MSKRLHVLVTDREMREIQSHARSERVSVGEWVRRTLREARTLKPAKDAEFKLLAMRRAADCSFQTANIADMLDEIEHGYRS